MPEIASREDAQLFLEWTVREINKRAEQGKAWLQSVQGVFSRMRAEGFKPELLQMANQQLNQAAERAEEIKQLVVDIVGARVISKEQGDQLFSLRSQVVNGILTLSSGIKNAVARAELGWLAEGFTQIGQVVSDFAKFTGITATLRNVWEALKGAAEAVVETAGGVLKWLPWVALGVGAILVLPYLARAVQAVKTNPQSPRRGQRGRRAIPLVPILAGAAAGAAAIYFLSRRGEQIPTVPGTVTMYKPIGKLATDIGTKALIAVFGANKIDYQLRKTPDGQYEILVKVEQEAKALPMLEAARLTERSVMTAVA